MTWAADILDGIEYAIDRKNYKGIKIFTVKSLQPLIFAYEGVDGGTIEGDLIYINPLLTHPLIDIDEKTLLELQTFNSSTAYNSPTFQATIEGSVINYIKDFYSFYQNWQSVYRLNVGDLVVAYEIKDNSFLILQKVHKDFIQEETKEDKGEKDEL